MKKVLVLLSLAISSTAFAGDYISQDCLELESAVKYITQGIEQVTAEAEQAQEAKDEKRYVSLSNANASLVMGLTKINSTLGTKCSK